MFSVIIINAVNSSKMSNNIKADFYLPYFGMSRIIVSGVGSRCNIKSLISKTTYKSEESPYVSEKRNCDCCILI
jgi:hypothetical protein